MSTQRWMEAAVHQARSPEVKMSHGHLELIGVDRWTHLWARQRWGLIRRTTLARPHRRRYVGTHLIKRLQRTCASFETDIHLNEVTKQRQRRKRVVGSERRKLGNERVAGKQQSNQ